MVLLLSLCSAGVTGVTAIPFCDSPFDALLTIRELLAKHQCALDAVVLGC